MLSFSTTYFLPNILVMLSLMFRLSASINGLPPDQYSSASVSLDTERSFHSRAGAPYRPSDTGGNRYAYRGGYKVIHSFIDRDDDLYDDDDFLWSRDGPNGMSKLFNAEEELFSLENQYQQHDRWGSWKNPLDSLAPLPSLSTRTQTAPPMMGGPSTLPTDTDHAFIHSSQQRQYQKQRETGQIKNSPPELRTRSTGTTIAAVLASNRTVLILASDTRATDGSTVADKRCEKIHRLALNVWCAGAGTSADIDAMVRRTKFAFWRKGVLTREDGPGIGNMGTTAVIGSGWGRALGKTNGIEGDEDDGIPMASVTSILHYLRVNLHQYQGSLGVNLLVGGYDPNKDLASLAAIHPHGSMDVVSYAALGSGGLAATGVLESRYPTIGFAECSVEEGIRLVVDAVRAGIDNDLGSGSQVDVCIVGKEGVLYQRGVVKEEQLQWLDKAASEPKGTLIKEKQIGDDVEFCGVNGFGNVPFAIQSKRIVLHGRRQIIQNQEKWLRQVLGRT